MAIKLFVGNLPYGVDDAQLEDLFGSFGTIISAKIIIDRDSNRSKGFGFVEMEDEAAVKAAIEELNDKELEGRRIVVNVARPPEPRERRQFGGNDRDRRGGGGGRDSRERSGGGRRY